MRNHIPGMFVISVVKPQSQRRHRAILQQNQNRKGTVRAGIFRDLRKRSRAYELRFHADVTSGDSPPGRTAGIFCNQFSGKRFCGMFRIAVNHGQL